MTQDQLSKVKAEVQKILDHHLNENQRFSILDFDEESTFLLISLLTEEDDLEREHIRAKIQEKLSLNQMNIDLNHEEIINIKDKLGYLKNNYSYLNDLKNIVNTDEELEDQLNNI